MLHFQCEDEVSITSTRSMVYYVVPRLKQHKYGVCSSMVECLTVNQNTMDRNHPYTHYKVFLMYLIQTSFLGGIV